MVRKVLFKKYPYIKSAAVGVDAVIIIAFVLFQVKKGLGMVECSFSQFMDTFLSKYHLV